MNSHWKRKQFEDWCKRQKPPLRTDRTRTGYIEYATYWSWKGWLAAQRQGKRKTDGQQL